jgi:cyclic-di-GMP phosphodiesterase TipF (flagellum assembly factor)
MKRLVVAFALVAGFCAAVYVLYVPVDGWPIERRLVLISIVTLVASAAAAVLAFWSFRRTSALRADLAGIARSMDIALHDFAKRSTQDVATISEMNEQVARELERVAAHLALRKDRTRVARTPANNVVPLPSPAPRPKPMPAYMPAANDGQRGPIEAAYRKALAAGTFELSLQPIVSIARGAAVGFEAYASLPVEGSDAVSVRRLAETLPGLGSASFERILLNEVLQAGRRRLGDVSEQTPVHVAVSEAMLVDSEDLNTVLERFELNPELARSVVLSLPLEAFNGHGAEALSRLASFGVRFAAEGWNETKDGAAAITGAGVSYVKISGKRLPDRETSSIEFGMTAALVEAAASAGTVIATDIASDEDAVRMIDLGIDLMVGERFSGPRRLKAEGDRPGRAALH